MTATDAGPEPAAPPPGPPPPSPSQVRRLVRRRDDRMVAGVCAALGTYTDIDPVVYRVVFGVLTVFGGAGLVLYGIAWLFLPAAETGLSAADSLLRRRPGRRAWPTAGIAVLLGSGLLILLAIGSDSGAVLAVLALLGFLLLRDRAGGPSYPAGDPSQGAPYAAQPAAGPADGTATVPFPAGFPQGQYAGPPAGSYPGAATGSSGGSYPGAPAGPYGGSYAVPPPPPLPPRPRSPLGPVTLCVALVAVGTGLLLDEAGVLTATARGLFATALVIVGGGLVVGAWIGRARWLVLPAIALAIGLGASSVVDDVPLNGGTGDRVWAPASAAEVLPEYRFRGGEALLDLTRLGPIALPRTVAASVGAGQLDVLVPAGMPITVDAHAGLGSVHVFGETDDGFGADVETSPVTDNGLKLDLRVGVGEVRVTHVPS